MSGEFIPTKTIPRKDEGYGLRFFQDGKEVRLERMSGGGRIMLANMAGTKTRRWWTKAPLVVWEPYLTSVGYIFHSEEEARQVALNLVE